MMDVRAIAGYCPRDDAYPERCPVYLICYSREARKSGPREMFRSTDELFEHMA